MPPCHFTMHQMYGFKMNDYQFFSFRHMKQKLITALPYLLADNFSNLTCILRNLYAGQKVAVRTEHGTTDWFQIGKGVRQGCILSPCLFNLYAEYIMRNAGLEETQAGIKIAGRNINNLRYADDTTIMARSKEELKSLLMKVKERVKKLA